MSEINTTKQPELVLPPTADLQKLGEIATGLQTDGEYTPSVHQLPASENDLPQRPQPHLEHVIDDMSGMHLVMPSLRSKSDWHSS